MPAISLLQVINQVAQIGLATYGLGRKAITPIYSHTTAEKNFWAKLNNLS